jgi:hypothetical protein
LLIRSGGGYTGVDYLLVGYPSIKSAEQLKGAIIVAAGAMQPVIIIERVAFSVRHQRVEF